MLLTLAPGSGDAVLVHVGKGLARRNNGIGGDFALVSVRPELSAWASPTTVVIGGPCGQYTGFGPQTVAPMGHGLVIGTGGTPRVGLALTGKTNAYGWDRRRSSATPEARCA